MFVTVTLCCTGLPPELKETVGVEIASLAVNVSVTIFPTFTNVVLALLDARATEDKVGDVLSNTTPVPEMRVDVFEEFPELSVAVTVNPILPSVFEEVEIYEAVQVFPDTLVINGVELAVTPPDVNTTVGVEITSLDVKVSVILSPVLANVVEALFEESEVDVSIGAELSMVTVAAVEVA